jgi:hypothetical protein
MSDINFGSANSADIEMAADDLAILTNLKQVGNASRTAAHTDVTPAAGVVPNAGVTRSNGSASAVATSHKVAFASSGGVVAVASVPQASLVAPAGNVAPAGDASSPPRASFGAGIGPVRGMPPTAGVPPTGLSGPAGGIVSVDAVIPAGGSLVPAGGLQSPNSALGPPQTPGTAVGQVSGQKRKICGKKSCQRFNDGDFKQCEHCRTKGRDYKRRKTAQRKAASAVAASAAASGAGVGPVRGMPQAAGVPPTSLGGPAGGAVSVDAVIPARGSLVPTGGFQSLNSALGPPQTPGTAVGQVSGQERKICTRKSCHGFSDGDFKQCEHCRTKSRDYERSKIARRKAVSAFVAMAAASGAGGGAIPAAISSMASGAVDGLLNSGASGAMPPYGAAAGGPGLVTSSVAGRRVGDADPTAAIVGAPVGDPVRAPTAVIPGFNAALHEAYSRSIAAAARPAMPAGFDIGSGVARTHSAGYLVGRSTASPSITANAFGTPRFAQAPGGSAELGGLLPRPGATSSEVPNANFSSVNAGGAAFGRSVAPPMSGRVSAGTVAGTFWAAAPRGPAGFGPVAVDPRLARTDTNAGRLLAGTGARVVSPTVLSTAGIGAGVGSDRAGPAGIEDEAATFAGKFHFHHFNNALTICHSLC